jgi:hypothetical protein
MSVRALSVPMTRSSSEYRACRAGSAEAMAQSCRTITWDAMPVIRGHLEVSANRAVSHQRHTSRRTGRSTQGSPMRAFEVYESLSVLPPGSAKPSPMP